MKTTRPSYVPLYETGELNRRVSRFKAIMESCDLCPHECRVDRTRGCRGFCRAFDQAVVSDYGPHPGEEAPLLGEVGSGTIFFAHCTLRCVFCQNMDIAHGGRGRTVSDETLAEIMLDIERSGAPNVNLVTPTHFLPNILAALKLAVSKGFRLPLCYNTSGYEKNKTIELLDGVIDIYLPDFKFTASRAAARYIAGSPRDYPVHAKASIKTMHRQVGDLVTDDEGTAVSGLIVRHLIMPNRAAGTKEFVKWMAKELSKTTYLNLMGQYHPPFGQKTPADIDRPITKKEYIEAFDWALEAGLTNLDRDAYDRYRRLKRR